MTREWITRLAADERKRDDERSEAAAAAERRADFVRIQGRRLIDQLRSTVDRDIDAFRREFPDDLIREVILEVTDPGGGFVIRKPMQPTVALSVKPNLPAESVRCEYRFTPENGLPPRDDRVDFLLIGYGTDNTMSVKHAGTGQVFNDADTLSEYLLVPVLTGRPR